MNIVNNPQTFVKVLELAKDYADTIFKGSLSEFGNILSDRVGYWRLKNQVQLLIKAKVMLEQKGIKHQKLLPDVFVPILDDGGNVENETLSDMFASLLACHVDIENHENVHPSFTKVLSQLSSIDANLMLVFRKNISYQEAREAGLRGPFLLVEDIANDLEINKRIAYLSCLNLSRLGIIEHKGFRQPDNHPIPTMFRDIPDNQKFQITEYGIAFCDACNYTD